MSEIKAKLQEEREIEDGRTVQVYEVGNYQVIVRGRKDNSHSRIFVDIWGATDRRYFPPLSVYDHVDRDRNLQMDVWVGTVSYGSMPLDDIAKYMEAMQEAVAVAQYIQDNIVKPIERGTWTWEV